MIAISSKVERLALTLGALATSLSLCACSEESRQVHATTPVAVRGPATANIVHLAPEAQKALKLKLASACLQTLDFSVKTTGEVVANANLLTHVNSPVTGRVTEVRAILGDHVAQGQPLLIVRSNDIEQAEADLLQNEAQVRADLKRDLLQIDSDISQAQAQIKLSESTYNRAKSLVDEKIASRAEFEAARTQFEKDKITLDTLTHKRTATISLSSERMKLLTEPVKQKLRTLGLSDVLIQKVLKSHEIDPDVPVLAPETGVVSERTINVGELVDPSKCLFTIGDFHGVWVKADVYEKDIAKVKEGQPIVLELDSFPGESFHGKLNYVADSVNQETRTLLVRADVANPALKLKPKMFARMNIMVGEHRVLAVPRGAVQDAGSYKVVYIPTGSGCFEERKVKLGAEIGNFVEVLAGLRTGEQVVTEGSFDLRSQSLRESD